MSGLSGTSTGALGITGLEVTTAVVFLGSNDVLTGMVSWLTSACASLTSFSALLIAFF